MSNHGLPSPPLDDHDHKSHISRKMSKPSKSLNRSSKRSSPSHEHSAIVMDGRHKRVWKACERCRMKKTKCDGESPCKRCKDDGLVCTAGSRKKTEFKQLPRGYAEVLENTQYALIATVQKLYTMVRNGEQWDLGEPELNDRGQPVIHDIASKLGCIRASPDLPYAFPEGEQDFAELQAQLQSARSEMASEDHGSRKHSEDSSSYSPGLQRTERASSSESDHSNLSKDYNQNHLIWQQRQAMKLAPRKLAQLNIAPQRLSYEEARPSLDTTNSMDSPMFSEYQTESPMYNDSPFSPWGTETEFLAPVHALDTTALFMKQAQIQKSSPLARMPGIFHADSQGFLEGAQMTISPNMLDSRYYENEMMEPFQPSYGNIPMSMA